MFFLSPKNNKRRDDKERKIKTRESQDDIETKGGEDKSIITLDGLKGDMRRL